MPNNLTDDGSSYPVIQVPAPGDPRTDTSVVTGFQGLANRTANITGRLDAIAAATKLGYSPPLPAGVSVGTVSFLATSLAALQSIPAANRFDGMFCTVKDSGEYQFDVVRTDTAVTNTIIQPNDVIGAAPGRWFSKSSGLFNAANGLPQLDASARVPAAIVRNGLIYDKASQGSITTAAAVITGTPISLPGLLVGDLIKFVYSVQMTVALGHWAQIQCNTIDPGIGTVAQAQNNLTSPATGTPPFNGTLLCGVGSYLVVNAGTHSVQLYAVTDGTVCSYQFASLNVTVTRP